MNKRWLLGLSSGTSCNGIDAALVEVSGIGLDLRLRLAHCANQAHARDLRELLLRADASPGLTVRQVNMLHRILGESFAHAVRTVADQAKLPLTQVLCVGLSGHTLWHETETRFPSTL